MERDRIKHELGYYRSYKVALMTTNRILEDEVANDTTGSNRYEAASACRVTVYDDMPRGGGSGARAPGLSGGMSFEEAMELQSIQEIVIMLDLALDALTEIEREVLTMKWMDDITLNRIAEMKMFSKGTAKTIHGRALDKMYNSLRFYNSPKIELHAQLPVA